MKNKVFAIIALIILEINSSACAEIHVGKSLEWMTVEAPVIIRGVVVDVKTSSGLVPQQPLWSTQEVMVQIQEVLKGDINQPTLTWLWDNVGFESAELWKTDQQERLFFLKRGSKDYYGTDFSQKWVLYDGYPYVPVNIETFDRPPVLANMTTPKMADVILSAVKARLSSLNAADHVLPQVSHPEIALGFGRTPNGAVTLRVPEDSEAYRVLWSGSSCFLIVPADKEYLQKAQVLSGSEKYEDRILAAQLLASYPGEESVRNLKKLLMDTSTHTEQVISSAGKSVWDVYGVRQMAYQSLQRLGVVISELTLRNQRISDGDQ